MSDDLQNSWDRLMGNKPKRAGALWLILGMVLGIAAQVGPGALAGLLGWSVWYAAAWGFAVAFYSTVIKSNVGRGFASGSRPKHWLAAIAITLPIGALAFCALNIGAWWLAGWLFR